MRARLAGACLVHGDVNPGNVLLPRAGAGPVYLIDRQPFEWSLTRWLGVSDLAYLMCAFWPAEQRRARERRMLSRYHAGLLALGVRGYDFDALWDDYRLCAMQTAHVAIEWCVLAGDRERMRWLWSAQLERAFAAMDDLGSATLWRP
jgi:Ser/Thr protein kinase RdoA (MazF antagonist)